MGVDASCPWAGADAMAMAMVISPATANVDFISNVGVYVNIIFNSYKFI
jgi:hypothetical protein